MVNGQPAERWSCEQVADDLLLVDVGKRFVAIRAHARAGHTEICLLPGKAREVATAILRAADQLEGKS